MSSYGLVICGILVAAAIALILVKANNLDIHDVEMIAYYFMVFLAIFFVAFGIVSLLFLGTLALFA